MTDVDICCSPVSVGLSVKVFLNKTCIDATFLLRSHCLTLVFHKINFATQYHIKNVEEKNQHFMFLGFAHKCCMLSELEITTLYVTACIEIQLRGGKDHLPGCVLQRAGV